jgi:hypothetical protein
MLYLLRFPTFSRFNNFLVSVTTTLLLLLPLRPVLLQIRVIPYTTFLIRGIIIKLVTSTGAAVSGRALLAAASLVINTGL